MRIKCYLLLSESSSKSLSCESFKEVWKSLDLTSDRWRRKWRINDHGGKHWCWNLRTGRFLSSKSSWLCNLLVLVLKETCSCPRVNRLQKSFMGCLLLLLQKHYSCLYWNLLCLLQWMVWTNLLCWMVANTLQLVMDFTHLPICICLWIRRSFPRGCLFKHEDL